MNYTLNYHALGTYMDCVYSFHIVDDVYSLEKSRRGHTHSCCMYIDVCVLSLFLLVLLLCVYSTYCALYVS